MNYNMEVPTLKEFNALKERVERIEKYIRDFDKNAEDCLEMFKNAGIPISE